MNNKLTDERPNDESLEILITTRREIAERHASEGRMGQCAVHTLILNALLELQERRKADSAEPVYQYRIRNGYNGQVTEWQTIRRDQVDFVLKAQPLNAELRIIAAPPASEREQIRREHAEWSESTFGNVGPVGPLKHLSKEALEAAAEPGDLSEWADMQFLLWDAQRRAGITDEQITRAMVEKLAVNKQREWPVPRDGEPRLHIKDMPAPVVPEEMPKGLAGQIVSLLAHNIGDKFLAQKIWNACRAALLQGSQPVSNCDELQVIGWLRSDYNSDDKRDHNAPLFMLGSNDPSEAWGVKYIPLSGNSPVIPGVYLADINTDHQH